MKEILEKMLELEKVLPSTETIISKKIDQKNHSFYLFYNRLNKEVHFAIELETIEIPDILLPKCRGLIIKWDIIPFTIGSKKALIISCLGNYNNEIFLRVVEDLLSHLELVIEEETMIHNAIGRISMWQEFFLKYGDNSFPAHKQKGLYGELLSLDHLSKIYSLREVIHAWVGPYGAPQDFNFKSFYLETKTTKNNLIRINGSKQLTKPKGKELYLHVIKVNKSELKGDSIVNAIERFDTRLRNEPDLLTKFHSKLLAYGYPLGGFDNPLLFEIEEEVFYNVKEGFPSYEEKYGINYIEYEVDLSKTVKFKVGIDELFHKIKHFKEAVL